MLCPNYLGNLIPGIQTTVLVKNRARHSNILLEILQLLKVKFHLVSSQWSDWGRNYKDQLALNNVAVVLQLVIEKKKNVALI